MGVPSFFKQYGPRGLNMIPRYYDPEREKREERVKRIKAELGIEDDGKHEYVPRIQKGTMSNYFVIFLLNFYYFLLNSDLSRSKGTFFA